MQPMSSAASHTAVQWSKTSSALPVSVVEGDGRVLVRVAGELDIASVPDLAKALQRAVEHPCGRVLVDASRVTFCGTAGVELLLHTARQARAAGGSLVLQRAHSSVLRALQLCGDAEGERMARESATVPLPRHERLLRLSVLSAALSAAFTITGAPMGNAQLYQPQDGTLQIVAQRGFQQPFLTYFATVADRDTACAVAAQDRLPVLVDDVAASALFYATPALDVLQEAGVGACVSLPITAADGTLIGVVSTHHPHATRFTDEQRRALQRLGTAAHLVS
ncbi:STAS domain-containing protein [Streptomyces sp. NPDC004732]|uniref:STAS domain-containing protein n=1 Tax=Streptomyces sp. NPDC004732 TaxID=3154290 RepID=UPI0033B35CF8